MPSKTPTTKKGVFTLEFAILLPLIFFLCSACLMAFLILGARSYLYLEAYTLARAHLYGEELSRCSPGSVYPKNLFKIEMHCESPTRIRASLHYKNKILLSEAVDLNF